MTHFKYRSARVYAAASPQTSAADAAAEPSYIQYLEDALAQLGAESYIVDRELRTVRLCSSHADRAGSSSLLVQPALGQPFGGCVAPEHRATLESACASVVGGQRAEAACELALPDAADPRRLRQLRLTVRPVYSRDQTVVGAALTIWPAPHAEQTAEQTAEAARRERQRTRLLQLLNHIGARLASELNEDAIVHIVTEALAAQLGLAFARIWLLDPSGATLVLRSSAGLYTEIDGDFARIPLGRRAVGQIAALRQPLVTNDVPNTPGLGDREWALATGMRGFAGYPLIGRDRLIGVAGFFSYHTLDDDTVATLEPLAHQLALALERAQLSRAQTAERDKARALAAVATSRAAQLSATLAAIADGVWTCDQRGRLLTVNSAALRMFGLEGAERRLETLSDIVALFAPETPQRELCLGLPAALEGGTVRRELTLLIDGADRPPLTVFVTATPMTDEDGQVIGAVAVVHDVTQQKAMERLKDDFLSVAAHELKTPVTAIKGYAQLALMRLKASADSGPLQRALRTIEEQAERIAHLVNELVDASRIQHGQLELRLAWFDLAALVRRTVEQAQQQAPERRLTLDAPAALALVGDELRIEQVLQNLLDNALKYSPAGSPIQIIVAADARQARVVVVDHGIGISRDKQAHVFDAWFQAHGDTVGDFGGMGLGLNICKEVVERHGGQIWVESTQNQGSRFGFSMPLPKTS
jgi:PAS domain S-box-containing protein